MKDFNNLPQWLRKRIDKSGLTVEKFANRVKVSRTAVYLYLEDRTRPDTQVMARICHFLNVPLEEGLRQYVPKPTGRPRGSGSAREVSARQRAR